MKILDFVKIFDFWCFEFLGNNMLGKVVVVKKIFILIMMKMECKNEVCIGVMFFLCRFLNNLLFVLVFFLFFV